MKTGVELRLHEEELGLKGVWAGWKYFGVKNRNMVTSEVRMEGDKNVRWKVGNVMERMGWKGCGVENDDAVKGGNWVGKANVRIAGRLG